MAGLDDLVGGLLGGSAGDGQTSGRVGGKLVSALSGAIGSGGLEGLVGKLSEGGLGDAVSSWISTDDNQKVNGSQVREALGDDTVAKIAKETGASDDDAASGLASLLPQLIDKVTPDGTLPKDLDISKALGGLLGK